MYVFGWIKTLNCKNILLSKQIYFLNDPNWQKSKMAAKIWKNSNSKYHHFLTNIHGKLIRNLQIDFHWKEFNKNYFKPFNIVQMVQLPHIQQNAKFKLSQKTMPGLRQQA